MHRPANTHVAQEAPFAISTPSWGSAALTLAQSPEPQIHPRTQESEQAGTVLHVCGSHTDLTWGTLQISMTLSTSAMRTPPAAPPAPGPPPAPTLAPGPPAPAMPLPAWAMAGMPPSMYISLCMRCERGGGV